jgi:NadR type nicotinamide-nucleotide adenylyltransferase
MEKTSEEKLIRIVLYGPESTGKTMLSMQLSAHFNTIWIPEFARHYLDVKKAVYDPFGRSAEEICQPQDIPQIVIGQIANEDSFSAQAKRVVFFDTNPLMTYAYNLHYFHRRDEWIAEVVQNRSYDLYLLMNVDVPWVPDPPFRDRPEQREEMFELFRSELIARDLPFELICGSYKERFESAVKAIEMRFPRLGKNKLHESE